MRNSEINLVTNFVEEIMPFMAKAEEYVATHTKKYPRVYYSKCKNGKYGITLPGVFDISHSANNCPDGYNTLVFATAWSMKVDELLSLGNYTYLEWCKKYNYLNRGNNSWFTGAEYIRLDVSKCTDDSPNKEYQLYIPQTGHEYLRVYKNKEEKNFTKLKEAIFVRNRYLYNMVMSGKDSYGVLEESRIRKYRRILVKGYFQCAIIYRKLDELSREANRERYLHNKETFAKVFANAERFCLEDDLLKETFAFYKDLLNGDLSIYRVNEIYTHELRLREYFKAISLFKDTADCIFTITRYETTRIRQARKKLFEKFA
jgi:hypothetical protein